MRRYALVGGGTAHDDDDDDDDDAHNDGGGTAHDHSRMKQGLCGEWRGEV